MSQDNTRSQDRILFHLKTRGPQTAAGLGAMLGITPAGARMHLVNLVDAGLAETESQREGRGRPKQYWKITELGHARFPDRHSDLTIELVHSIRNVFGDRGLEQLIEHRERASIANYQKLIGSKRSLKQRLEALAQIRTNEGYMASVSEMPNGDLLLIENHCPICAAAAACQGLCRSELAVFRALLGAETKVDRVDHIVAGARRCAYSISGRSHIGKKS